MSIRRTLSRWLYAARWGICAARMQENMQAAYDRPGLAFVVGDRIKARDHRRVDDEGGVGTVRDVRHWNKALRRECIRVEFDSMPGRLFSMAATELEYER
jgi:hypothetical protein